MQTYNKNKNFIIAKELLYSNCIKTTSKYYKRHDGISVIKIPTRISNI